MVIVWVAVVIWCCAVGNIQFWSWTLQWHAKFWDWRIPHRRQKTGQTSAHIQADVSKDSKFCHMWLQNHNLKYENMKIQVDFPPIVIWFPVRYFQIDCFLLCSYNVMLECWKEDPQYRPSFAVLLVMLNKIAGELHSNCRTGFSCSGKSDKNFENALGREFWSLAHIVQFGVIPFFCLFRWCWRICGSSCWGKRKGK